ncbi:MAG: ribosome-associated translation inhibitor RaiA [Bacteroidetes bacterium]|jgi:putative sigma-54 modulation protein|nr:ribosome-associated translation inhibitor RaiA [Bacteroidota bacterium]MBT6687315.1 ribosome-associated translation inhibitor RaiA [Bacteroidota bacterium]MBT7491108.1 ribosome-associated translation inhibitor RaiA [Bacteroidota bacterium]
MNIKIHSVRFDADAKLVEFVEARINKLIQLYDNIIGVEVFLRLVNNQNQENKVTEIRIEIPVNDLFAKKQEKTFEAATDSAIEALRRQIKKHKEKQRGV